MTSIWVSKASIFQADLEKVSVIEKKLLEGALISKKDFNIQKISRFWWVFAPGKSRSRGFHQINFTNQFYEAFLIC